MRNLNLLSILLGLVFFSSSCSDSEDNEVVPSLPGAPTVEIGQEFAKLFPGVTDVQWKDGGDGYKVATFTTKKLSKGNTLKTSLKSLETDNEEYPTEGWFTTEGSCDMIESEVTMDNIPQVIVDAWKQTEEYKDKYTVYDVDYIVYRSNPIIKIETEFVDDFYNDGCDLFYNLEGELLFSNVRMDLEEENKNKENRPVPEDMHSYIENLYPGYIIADFEELQEYQEELRYSIAAIYDGNLYNIEFNAETKKFVREYSEWKFSKLPQALQDALKAINPKVSDENTSAERVREENEDSTLVCDYQIDSELEGFAGKRFDEEGNEL